MLFTHVPLSPSSMIWYWVPIIERQCYAAWKVTIGLASHWPCATDISVSSGSWPREGRWALCLHSSRGMAQFTFTFNEICLMCEIWFWKPCTMLTSTLGTTAPRSDSTALRHFLWQLNFAVVSNKYCDDILWICIWLRDDLHKTLSCRGCKVVRINLIASPGWKSCFYAHRLQHHCVFHLNFYQLLCASPEGGILRPACCRLPV